MTLFLDPELVCALADMPLLLRSLFSLRYVSNVPVMVAERRRMQLE